MSTFEAADRSIIHAKDIVSFQIDAVGVLATPSWNEPIPEREETVSHLRAIPCPVDLSALDFTRCMFRIDTDAGQVCSLFM
jgi:hypothetical protein